MKQEDKIRDHLKTFRAKNGKTQKEMASYLGVSYVTYQEMEKGIVKSVKILNKIKDKTGYQSTQNNMYEKTKENPDSLDQKEIWVKNVVGKEFAAIIRIEAKLNVLLQNDAEERALQKGQSVIDELRNLDAAILKEASNLREEYKQNS